MTWGCPECGYSTVVYNTESHGLFVKRYRKCKRDSNHPRVTTIEIDMEEYRYMKDVCKGADALIETMKHHTNKIEEALERGGIFRDL